MNRLIYFVLLFFTLSCANIVPPAGGPKDEAAPILIISNPHKGELNFSGQEIELAFNEPIEAPNLLTELIITPYMENNSYTSVIRKDKLVLKFEKPLEENTTYTFNFGESIKDMTEGNKSKDVIIAFSTGSQIDTATVKGVVKDLLTNKAVENYIVGLYSAKDTLTPENSKPVYFTKTDPNGNYVLRNIKEDTFNIYSFSDENKNLIWNENEKTGFQKSILPGKPVNTNIVVFPFDGKEPAVKRVKYFPEKNDILLSEGVKEYQLGEGELVSVLSPDGKMISVYYPKIITDTIQTTIQLKDSVNLTAKDTIKLFYPEKEKGNVEKGLSISVMPNDLKLKPGLMDVTLQFSQPVTESRTEEVYYYSDTLKEEFTKENFKWINSTSLSIKKEIKANDSIQLIIPEKSFISFDTFNLKTNYTFTFLQDENFGTIRGRVITEKPNYIIQLLDSKYEVKESLINPTTLNFTFLPAGSYMLRAIVDENKNEEWDQGNPYTFTQPEPVLFYDTKIELRANWEINDIKFTF